jgi:hypothetical protein
MTNSLKLLPAAEVHCPCESSRNVFNNALTTFFKFPTCGWDRARNDGAPDLAGKAAVPTPPDVRCEQSLRNDEEIGC